MNDELANVYYRKLVKDVCMQYNTLSFGDDDDDFEKYLESNYNSIKQELNAGDSNLSQNSVQTKKLTLFIFSVGLLTFGKLIVVSDILDNIPNTGGIKQLSLGVKAMLPLPNNMNPLDNLDAVRDWFNCNQRILIWNKILGKFEFIVSE